MAGRCDDHDANALPGATETCDDVDDDCDGTEDLGAVDATAWYADDDADGYGAGAAIFACGAPDAWYDGVDSDCAGDDLETPAVSEKGCGCRREAGTPAGWPQA